MNDVGRPAEPGTRELLLSWPPIDHRGIQGADRGGDELRIRKVTNILDRGVRSLGATGCLRSWRSTSLPAIATILLVIACRCTVYGTRVQAERQFRAIRASALRRWTPGGDELSRPDGTAAGHAGSLADSRFSHGRPLALSAISDLSAGMRACARLVQMGAWLQGS